jgi:N-sulfoglucosamine sulfohydrolase
MRHMIATTTRRQFLRGITAVTAVLTLSPCLAETPKSPKPNFILIIGDDISIDDFGCYGHPHIRTPNIDKLAANGIRFTNAYLTASQCSPTRCSVISGRYPHNSGGPELHQPLPADQPMFPLELKKAGYHTVAAGKWHLGPFAAKAFDKMEKSGPGGEERWVECLQQRPKDKPFFMWFASLDAHRPWQAEKAAEKHQRSDAVIPPYMADMEGTREDLARYYDEIQRLDRYVGLVVRELKKQEVLDNTIVVFMADNGRPFPRCKTWMYDGGIKTPFILHWPRGIDKPGTTSSSLVSAIDIAPTVLTLAGLKNPQGFQGISMIPILKNPKATIRSYAFAEHNWHDIEAHERMVRWKQWVYIRNARPERSGLAPAHLKESSYRDLLVLQKDGKLTAAQSEIFLQPRPAEMLFDVDTDPHQLKNLVSKPEFSEALAHLRGVMDEWQKRTGDTVPEVLTPDSINRKTGKWLRKWNNPLRGTTPGSEQNATSIIDPGPR